MNYDKIILELLSRVQELEEQMSEVKGKLSSIEIEEELIEAEQDEFTRSQARDKAIKIIQQKYPDYLVEKASRKEGSGIRVYKPNSKKPLIIKFYHSKTHNPSGELEHGWHVVHLDNVIETIIDFCIFSLVDSNGKWNFFIYEPEELGWYYKNHRSSENDILHLYFSVIGDKAIETRENKVDVSDHLNNWEVLQ